LNPIHRVAFIGNSLPRRCGIATFTTDLQQAVGASPSAPQVTLVAMTDAARHYEYPPVVGFQIHDEVAEEYDRAADFLNARCVDVVSLQHEFGIFGGEAGGLIVQLLRRLKMPIVTTFHTVLAAPGAAERRVFNEVLNLSAGVVVMAERARGLLETEYGVPSQKIEVIPHGIPDSKLVSTVAAKRRRGFSGRPVLLTFGLLSPNKGVEVMIDAMPAVLRDCPDAVYVVLGATHPTLIRREGEGYRERLQQRVRALGIESAVVFIDHFVDQATLTDFINMCDVYVTPYLNEAQMTSGTLAYSFGLGKAVVSTPYWHAQELLANGRGVLVPFGDSAAIGTAVAQLLMDDVRRNLMSANAYAYSRSMTWGATAHRYMNAFGVARARHQAPAQPGSQVTPQTVQTPSVTSQTPAQTPRMTPPATTAQASQTTAQTPHMPQTTQQMPHASLATTTQATPLATTSATPQAATVAPLPVPKTQAASNAPPRMQLNHFISMCDDTGLLQHATHTIPDRSHGYCVDDNARALMLSCALNSSGEDPMPERQTVSFASFVQHAWNRDTHRFRNFMSFERRWLEDSGSEDSHGRVIWALGRCAESDSSPSRRTWAAALLQEAVAPIGEFQSPRACAFSLLGLEAYSRSAMKDLRYRELQHALASRLVAGLKAVETPEWVWFEDELAYDNARLSQALIVTGLCVDAPAYVDAGLRSLRWLTRIQTTESGDFRAIGTESFGAPRTLPRRFDQQPVEAAAAVSACIAASRADPAAPWLSHARTAFAWYLGRNDLGVTLIDAESGSCSDGLHPDRLNANRGAESVVSYLLALAEVRKLARSSDSSIAPVLALRA